MVQDGWQLYALEQELRNDELLVSEAEMPSRSADSASLLILLQWVLCVDRRVFDTITRKCRARVCAL